MKFVKELPFSIYHTLVLRVSSVDRMIRGKETLPIVVSLTSIPDRLSTLDIVIRSLFRQTHLPEKIVLWLNEDLKNRLPKNLSRLQNHIFEIRYSPLTCSHRKLILSLEHFPDMPIITCDDDLIYHKEWLFKTYQEHLRYPNDIIANETTQIKYDDKGRFLPFIEWRERETNYPALSLLPIGARGILYPPRSLHPTVLDQDLFLTLTPKADDLWFKAMALLQGTVSRQSNNPPQIPYPIIGSQKHALHKENVRKRKNEEQWEALANHFELISILTKDQKQ